MSSPTPVQRDVPKLTDRVRLLLSILSEAGSDGMRPDDVGLALGYKSHHMHGPTGEACAASWFMGRVATRYGYVESLFCVPSRWKITPAGMLALEED